MGKGHRFVRINVEYVVEVVDETALEAAVLRGGIEEGVGAPGDFAPPGHRNDVNATDVLTGFVWRGASGNDLHETLETAGLRLVSTRAQPRIRKDDDPDTYQGIPEEAAMRDDGTFADQDA